MLGLSARRIRALARAGLVSPGRGDRGEYRFGFSDLVVLRTARGLLRAGVSFAHVKDALANLRTQLPVGRPLTSLRIVADGNRVVVHDDSGLWDAESHQVLFDFHVAELAEQVAPMARDRALEGRAEDRCLEAIDWFEIACDLEMTAPEEARDAYRRALEMDPEYADAHVNLGRLLHERGEVTAAEKHYRQALAIRATDLTALFNLGVALEDRDRLREASLAYREVLLANPEHADAHFNLAGVFERMGQHDRALEHLQTYRKLIGAVDHGSEGGC